MLSDSPRRLHVAWDACNGPLISYGFRSRSHPEVGRDAETADPLPLFATPTVTPMEKTGCGDVKWGCGDTKMWGKTGCGDTKMKLPICGVGVRAGNARWTGKFSPQPTYRLSWRRITCAEWRTPAAQQCFKHRQAQMRCQTAQEPLRARKLGESPGSTGRNCMEMRRQETDRRGDNPRGMQKTEPQRN